MGASLTDRQRKGLRTVGDLMVPGDEDLPAFSETGAGDNAEVLVGALSRQDRKDFLRLLTVLGWLPRPLVAGFLWLGGLARSHPAVTPDLLREVQVGLKGVVMSLYYSDWTEEGRVHRVLGWDADVSTPEESIPEDQKRSREALEMARERARWSE